MTALHRYALEQNFFFYCGVRKVVSQTTLPKFTSFIKNFLPELAYFCAGKAQKL
jgi:hypothetical protein